MSVRADLLHLSPEALAQATNAGIVKRALRELAAGYRPRLALDATGMLDAAFEDNVQCRWPSGMPIQQASCSCGAAGVCRHRVIVALAYREQALPAPADEPGGGAATPAAAEPPPPERADDDALARTIPASLLDLAGRLADSGLSVELRRRASGEPCDTARLPSATVRYWAGAAIEAARCDCLRAAACEHVALGVWAFRRAAADAPSAPIATVRLGGAGTRHHIDRAPFDALITALLRHGVARGAVVLAQPLSSARAATGDAAWLGLLLADLEAWCEAYSQRSALYDAAQGVDLLAELALRLAAGAQPGRGESVLGLGVAGDTALDRLRLMCLGARTVRDGERRRTTLVMADVDTGTRLVLPHDWRVPAGAQADEAALRAAERLAPGVRLEALARGQLLAQQAARRADGSVRLARARSAQNSVLPQSGDWAQLLAPVRFESVAALAAEQRAHPNAALLPRHAARRFVVFSGAVVEELGYDAQEQSVLALLRDGAGEPLLLERTHERHVPHALGAVAAALSGRAGRLRHVAGLLDWDHGRPRIEPWAIGCDAVVVPDFAGAASGALAALPLTALPPEPADPCAQRLAQLRRHLGALVHHGLSGLPRSWPADNARIARELTAAGLRELGGRVQALGEGLSGAAGDADAPAAAHALAALVALRQLHEDAATLAGVSDAA
ncbi:hypothetical protein HLB44_35135 [Aquincola sp. S2]|uniref:SWIM-type domain-containing protein n=1 Tax=Pseudaquabacterium terrae TaxID=2732868 RepID=A0ABX2EUS8_9BURK|nr:hypothetical protein [Aquabacterium terrae]NRF72232.1 hypothetical protein [Aquabacterium terrae]